MRPSHKLRHYYLEKFDLTAREAAGSIHAYQVEAALKARERRDQPGTWAPFSTPDGFDTN